MKTSTFFKTSLSLAALALTGAFNASAQITLNEGDMAQVGGQYIFINDTTPTVTPGSAGANQTWNLTGINNSYIDTTFALSPSSTPYNSSFPSSNLAMKAIIPGAGESYEYANLGSDSLLVMGTVVSNMGELNYGTYKPADIGMVFPATYNTQWTGSAINTVKVGISPGDSAKEVILVTYTNVVDGWGTVTTPAGSFNALRVSVTFQPQYDSLYECLGGTWVFAGMVPSSKAVSYNWYAKGQGNFVAEIEEDGNGNVLSADYMKNAVPAGINEITNNLSVSVYPNPASDYVNILISSAAQTGYVKVLDITGREVENDVLNNGKIQINTSAYANGMYLYLITDNNGNLLDKGKFTVNH